MSMFPSGFAPPLPAPQRNLRAIRPTNPSAQTGTGEDIMGDFLRLALQLQQFRNSLTGGGAPSLQYDSFEDPGVAAGRRVQQATSFQQEPGATSRVESRRRAGRSGTAGVVHGNPRVAPEDLEDARRREFKRGQQEVGRSTRRAPTSPMELPLVRFAGSPGVLGDFNRGNLSEEQLPLDLLRRLMSGR